jgi:hypothetical protein
MMAGKKGMKHKTNRIHYREIIFKAWNRGELSAGAVAYSTGIPLRIVRQYIPLTKEG